MAKNLRGVEVGGSLVHVGFENPVDLTDWFPSGAITELTDKNFPDGYEPGEWKLVAGALTKKTQAEIDTVNAPKKARTDRITALKAKSDKTLEERVELLEKIVGL